MDNDTLAAWLGFIALLFAFISWLNARSAKKRATQAQAQLQLKLDAAQKVAREHGKLLLELQQKIAALESAPRAPAAVEALAIAGGANAPSGSAPAAAAAEAAPAALQKEAAKAATPVDSKEVPTLDALAASLAAKERAAASEPLAPAAPRAAAEERPAAKPAAKAGEDSSLEEKIALVWFTRIGALAMLFGVAFFFKYAVDNDWIGPLGRVALGAIAGAAVLAFAEAQKSWTKPIFLQVALGVGLSFFYLSAWASAALYHLVPNPAAFAAIVVTSLLGGALAVRHRGEGVLVLSLLAGFLCPILLSTGRDLPGPLFAYLFCVTALAFWTAVRMGFPVATGLGIAGTAILFAGWYGKFFDASAPVPQTNFNGDPAMSAGGRYFPLGTRAVPLLGVLAFLAEWLWVQQRARKSEHRDQLKPVAMLVTALLLAHAGVAVLLFDHQVLLGLLLAGLAVLSNVLLSKEEKPELLALPLLASFVSLLVCARGSQQQPGAMLAVIGLTGAIYSVGILRKQVGAARAPDAKGIALISGVGIAVAILCGALLLEQHAQLFAFVLIALSLAFALLAAVARLAPLAAGAAAFSFAGLLISLPERSAAPRPPVAPFLVAAALWAAIYFAGAARDLLRKREPATPARLFTLSGAGLGYVAIALVMTGSDAWLLRSCSLLVVGALDLFAGARLLRAGSRQPATVLLGQALGLFAGAAAVLFSGTTVTLIWAALAAVAGTLAASEGDPQWLAGSALLFACTIARLFAVDLQLPEQDNLTFFNTLGAQGRLVPRFLVNARALALLGTGAAFLVPARALARGLGEKMAPGAGAPANGAADQAMSELLFRRASFVAFALGHLALLALCVTEARDLFFHAPPLPALPLPHDSLYAADFSRAQLEQAESLSMVTTVTLSLYAAMLVALGFGLRNAAHRFLGLSLFGIALAKLVLWDVWRLPRIEQMVVLVAMGALLLGSSFLYARFGKRLVTLLRDGELKTGASGAAILLLAATSLFAGSARAAETNQFTQARNIEGVIGPGLYRVELDPALYAASQAALADLRIAAPDGSEVPWFVREIPATQRLVRHDAQVSDAVTLPDGGSQAILDLGAGPARHNELTLEVGGGGDFLRSVQIESSLDRAQFGVLSRAAKIYRVSGEGGGVNTTVSYPPSGARWLRVTLAPGADHGELKITGAHLTLRTEETQVPLRALRGSVTPVERAPGASATRFLIDLGQDGAPVEQLALEIGTELFERRVAVRAGPAADELSPLTNGVLYRSEANENVTVRFGATRARYFRLEIEDGDNPPLAVRGASGLYVPQELILRAPSAGPLILFTGNANIGMPSYDLEAVFARSGSSLALSPAQLGPLAANPGYVAPRGPQAPPPPRSEQHRTLIIALLSALLLGLALWTLRLLRAPAGPSANPSSGNTTGEPPK